MYNKGGTGYIVGMYVQQGGTGYNVGMYVQQGGNRRYCWYVCKTRGEQDIL
jgi:hypothetical protein